MYEDNDSTVHGVLQDGNCRVGCLPHGANGRQRSVELIALQLTCRLAAVWSVQQASFCHTKILLVPLRLLHVHAPRQVKA